MSMVRMKHKAPQAAQILPKIFFKITTVYFLENYSFQSIGSSPFFISHSFVFEK